MHAFGVLGRLGYTLHLSAGELGLLAQRHQFWTRISVPSDRRLLHFPFVTRDFHVRFLPLMGFCPKMHAFRGRLGCSFSRLEAFDFAGFIGFGWLWSMYLYLMRFVASP